MKIVEHFYNIQGEGPNLGIPSYLIRLSGCNLHCYDCDTSYSWSPGKDISEVIDDIKIPEQCNNVIITGGEPTLSFDDDGFGLLMEKINGRSLEIETTALPADISTMKTSNIYDVLYGTNGVVGKICRFKKDNHIPTFRVSPKLDIDTPGYVYNNISLEDIFEFYKIRKRISDYNFTYKIVYYDEDKEIIEQFLDKCVKNTFFRKCMLSIMPFTPVGLESDTFERVYKFSCMETIRFCKEHGLRYTPRVHIDVYGLERGV